MIHASLCTGIGACELAATWIGWQNAFSCEIDNYCQRVLKFYYPESIHYGNIYETDFSEWNGKINVLTAGFPCQPFSCAGARKGAEDDRYLWPEVLRGIREIRPAWFIGENVAGITSMVLPGDEIEVGSYTDLEGESYLETKMHQQFIIDRICNDLENIGYSVQPVIIPACAVGAPHRRDRIWFIAKNTDGIRCNREIWKEESCTGKFRKPCPGDYERVCSETNNAPNTFKYRYCTQEQDKQTKGCRRENNGKPEKWGIPSKRTDGFYPIQRNDTKSDNERCEKLNPPDISNEQKQFSGKDIKMPNWRNFPAQSPVCCGDDGISSRLSGITFSKHRNESIKAYGNSMIPQVVYQIFKAIEDVENITK